MSITKEFLEIFSGEQKTSETEQETLLDIMTFMRDDREMGLGQDVVDTWNCKIQGVIEFIAACGKISKKQEDDLCMLLNRIQSGRD